MFRDGRISSEALERELRVLALTAEIYRRLDVAGVRAVATSAVRDASNQAEFLARASAALGTTVELITGREEARLIHQGVIARWPQPAKRVLMVDIGGGSAEIVASEDGRLADAVSRPLGALPLREMFLHEDPPSRRELGTRDRYFGDGGGSGVRGEPGCALPPGAGRPPARLHSSDSASLPKAQQTRSGGPARDRGHWAQTRLVLIPQLRLADNLAGGSAEVELASLEIQSERVLLKSP